LKKIREPFNAISHFAGAAAALIGVAVLLVKGAGSAARIAALLVYGASLLGLMCASGIYHSVSASPGASQIYRKLDHAAIYLLIAGTYTPFCVLAFTGFWGRGMLAVIWTLALAGIAVKVLVIQTPRWLTAGVYVAMGWLSLLALREMLLRLAPVSIGWLLSGGILYTLGAVIYITRIGNFLPGKFGFHELWHVFVLLGAGAHYAAVASIL